MEQVIRHPRDNGKSEVAADGVWPERARGLARPRIQLILLSSAVWATTFAATALGPLQEAARVALGLSDTHMALLQGPARAIPLVLCGVPLGLLVDRYDRMRLLILCGMLTVAAHIWTALAMSFAALFAARWLVGLAGAATLTAAISLIADLYAPARRGRALMVMGIFQVAGASAAFGLGGPLLNLVGQGPQSWRSAMMWLTSPLLLDVLLLLLTREPARAGVRIAEPSLREALGELWRFRQVITPLLGGVVIVDVAFGAAYIWAAPVFSRGFDVSPAHIGEIMSAVLLGGGLLGPICSGVLADYGQRTGGPRQTISILTALALLSAPAGLFAVAPKVSAAIGALAILLTLLPAISLMVTTVLTVVIPNELRGLGTAVLNAASVSFAYAAAPVAVSVLSGAMGGPAMIGKSVALLCVTTSAAGAAAFAFGRRFFPCDSSN